jgi:hypothetical protein
MSSSEDRAHFSVQRLLELWKKSEEYVAYALLVLIGIGEHLNVPIVRDSAISALAVIILMEFFDIAKDRKRFTDVLTSVATGVETLGHAIRSRKRFSNINEAVPSILNCIRECNSADKHIEIKWIGMTMWNAGAALTFAFNELAKEGAVRELILNLAMVDGEWLDVNPINAAWDSRRVKASELNLQQAFAKRKAGGFNWDCKINSYAHMPGIHGGLINGKYLFLGMAQWLDGDMHAGEQQYSFYTNRSADDREKIKIFEGWFDVCFNGRGHRPTSASAASSGS